MPKFFVRDEQIQENTIEIIGEDVKHIQNVLRLKNGEEICVCNVDKAENYLCSIEDFQSSKIQCKILEKLPSEAEPNVQVTVFQALPKQEKMEWILQKATELGMYTLVPVATKYCVVKLDEKDGRKKQERWQKIVESAAKQSGRDAIPQVSLPITVSEVGKQVLGFDLFLLAYEKEIEHTLKQELSKLPKHQKLKIGIFIGPEGGISEEEVQSLCKSGAKVVTLGKRILRTETVALNMLSNIIYELES